MGESITMYGVWCKDLSFPGGWARDSTGRFITSRSRGEIVAMARQMQTESGYPDRQYAAEAFGDNGFPEVLEKATAA